MPLNNQSYPILLFVIIFYIAFCPTKLIAGESFESTVQGPYFNLMESLKNDKKENIKRLLIQWESHVESVSTYSVDDYVGAIQMLQQDYSELLVQIEVCLENGKNKQNNYDQAWFVRMIDHFGESYLKNKEKSIHFNFGMIMGGSFENCCGSIMEKLFFKEAALYGAYRDYFNMFLQFYKKQPAEAQTQLASRKNEVDNFMDLIDRISIVKVMSAGGLHRRQLSEIKAKSSDKAIYEYFKANPPGCDIDPFRAMEAFRQAMKSR